MFGLDQLFGFCASFGLNDIGRLGCFDVSCRNFNFEWIICPAEVFQFWTSPSCCSTTGGFQRTNLLWPKAVTVKCHIISVRQQFSVTKKLSQCNITAVQCDSSQICDVPPFWCDNGGRLGDCRTTTILTSGCETYFYPVAENRESDILAWEREESSTFNIFFW